MSVYSDGMWTIGGPPEIYIVMGVAGCGKTTLGKAFARAYNAEFLDADDFHPAANIAKMSAGIPLTDDDRAPWLDAVGAALAQSTGTVVCACSALKEAYRERLTELTKWRSYIGWIWIKADRELLMTRLQARKDHPFNPLLLDSQLAILEEPLCADMVDARDPTDKQLEKLLSDLGKIIYE